MEWIRRKVDGVGEGVREGGEEGGGLYRYSYYYLMSCMLWVFGGVLGIFPCLS